MLDACAATSVEGLGITEQFQRCQEELATHVELAGGVGQLPLNLCPLPRDACQLLLKLGFGPARLAHQVEIVLLFGVQLVQTGGEPLLEGVDAAKLGENRVVELVADVGPELVAESHRGVLLFDGLLNVLDLQVRLVAGAGLATSTDEVEVRAPVAPAGSDDQALAASPTPDEALEPVIMLTGTGAATAVEGEYPLYAVEQLGGDQRFMSSGVLLAVMLHEAEVVAVAQDVVELAQRDWLG
ncbi:MAG TPA: hypothetical protein VHX38_01605 [Pseudonocardiaceae bacterium]|nr:hypothetical protein [Pseudonocardiaceae bacterium]